MASSLHRPTASQIIEEAVEPKHRLIMIRINPNAISTAILGASVGLIRNCGKQPEMSSLKMKHSLKLQPCSSLYCIQWSIKDDMVGWCTWPYRAIANSLALPPLRARPVSLLLRSWQNLPSSLPAFAVRCISQKPIFGTSAGLNEAASTTNALPFFRNLFACIRMLFGAFNTISLGGSGHGCRTNPSGSSMVAPFVAISRTVSKSG